MNKLYVSLAFLYDLASENTEYTRKISNLVNYLNSDAQKVLAEVVSDTLFTIARTPDCTMYDLIKFSPDLTLDEFLQYTQDKRCNRVQNLSLAPLPKFINAMSDRDINVNLPRWFEQIKRKINR